MVTHETYKTKRGAWLPPGQVRIEGEGTARKAFEINSGEPVAIGSVEKMSKSRKNVVDLDEFVSRYGADVARWFVLSDSPPERDVIYTDVGVEGARRFVQRVWRLVSQGLEVCAPKGTPKPDKLGPDALALRRATHKALDQVARSIEGLRFNVAVAQIYEFANVLGSALSKSGDGMAWAQREAVEFLVQMIGPMMPHLAEESWARLGYNTLLANEPWPQADQGLLVDDTITIAVQVNGKRRDELTIARTAGSDEIEAAALKLEPVVRALEGRSAKKVIVVPQKIVNVVV
jgi:leucyl-tRNA synthetase